jgi:DMATS type aromatic prenyltransferase
MASLKSLKPYQALARGMGFISKHESLWWSALAPTLEKMFVLSGYTTAQQFQHLAFFHRHVLSYLGSYPTVEEGFAMKNYVTYDMTPLELSLNFQGGKRTVRMNHLPITSLSRTSKDPFNQRTAVELVQNLKSLLPDFDLDLFNHFAKEIYIPDTDIFSVLERQPTPNFSSLALQNIAAYDFEGNDVRVKSYFCPLWKTLQTGQDLSDTTFNAIRSQKVEDLPYLDGVKMIEDYCRSDNAAAYGVKATCLSFDCSKSKGSRLKIYFHTRHTAFSKMIDIFTLGQRIDTADTTAAIDELRKLWYGVLNIPQDFPECDDLPDISAPTAGVLFNFELKPGEPIPEPKIYIPVAMYNGNDETIVHGLQEFFKRQNQMEEAAGYKDIFDALLYVSNPCRYVSIFQNLLTSSFTSSNGQKLTGTHHDISFAHKNSVSYVTAYYKPHITPVPAADLDQATAVNGE